IAGPYTGAVWSGNIIYNTNGAGAMPSGGYTSVNPLLARNATGTFHLQSGSPAIGAATGTYSAVTVDMDGQSRTAPLDKGADETSSAPVTAQILSTSMVGQNGGNPQTCVPVVASADDGNVPGNVLDNDLNTRWSANGDGQWIQFCLSSTTTVTGVQIAFYSGATRASTFDVLTSTDGTSWTTASSGRVSSGTSTNLETFTFTGRTAKYVRIVGHGNSVNAWNSYTEVRIQTSTTVAARIMEEGLSSKETLTSFPNPFHNTNTIAFYLEKEGHVQLSVTDIMGKSVAMLVNRYVTAGSHRTTFNAQQLAAGVYWVKLVYNGKIITRSMIKE
ncbi:MAG TPA: discoidin domain-containing protein, partial [Niastella sp.]